MWDNGNSLLIVALLICALSPGARCCAQDPAAGEGPTAGSDWELQQTYTSPQDPRSIIEYKAQVRASQRMARMAAMRWYGMYNERPTASPTPFTALYSPVWQMPGGRPYAWHHRGYSSVIVLPR